MEFDGVDDYGDFPGDITISEDFTIAFEINFADLSFIPDQHIIWKHQLHSNTDGGWIIQANSSSRLDFGYYPDGQKKREDLSKQLKNVGHFILY